MINTIKEFTEKFIEINKLGYIPSHQNSSGGIGRTLEDLLGITENNLNLPDFGSCELKASRQNSTSLITLVTCAPTTRKGNKILLNKYGYKDEDGFSTLNISLKNNFVSTKDKLNALKLVVSSSKIYIYDKNGDTGIFWDINKIKEKFLKKYCEYLIVAKAMNQITDKEYFHFISAYAYSNFDVNTFIDLINKGIIIVDIRLGTYKSGKNKGKAHDHGTGFRIAESKLPLLFKTKQCLYEEKND